MTPRSDSPGSLAADVMIDSPLWTAQPDAEAIVHRAIKAAAAAVDTGSARGAELAILLTDDSAIRVLNRDWRGFDKPTNVLSFPAAQSGGDDGAPHLGDIVIAYETTAREADAEGKTLADHLAHLTIHGFLHLLGYDHESGREADAMERLESAILARLGVPDPHAVRETEPSI
jgi:probable rRNA maturation factor